MTTVTLPIHAEPRVAIKPCRFCGTNLEQTFVDLGMSPLCETYPTASELNRGEVYYPLHAYVCSECLLVQLEEFQSGEQIFSEYPYFSSYSDSWLKHSEDYCAKVVNRFALNESSSVIEVASNDGYLLQYFIKQHIPVLGIEPARNVASVASEKGVPTLVRFFGSKIANDLAMRGHRADLVIGNNVLAQVPDLNDFVEGLRILLKLEGILTLEFPHLQKLIEHTEFDTIYHEHYSYFSLLTTTHILRQHGLYVFDVEELSSHGGSLRVYACRAESQTHPAQPSVRALLDQEDKAGLGSAAGYTDFSKRVKQAKLALMQFFVTAAREGKSVAGYGAPGKSATLLHHCGIGRDLMEYTVDRSPHKQGRLLPGTHIPIHSTNRIRETKPDYVMILPWNLKGEIMEQLQYIREWGGRFVVPIPEVAIY